MPSLAFNPEDHVPDGYFIMCTIREWHHSVEESAWGDAFLQTTRVETTYCGCHDCSGHETVWELPPEEWYWRSVERPVLVPILENETGALFEYLSKLGKNT